jgi:acetylornithine deacetylase/succinyl-diaminopimelate desuccinylase-like protein
MKRTTWIAATLAVAILAPLVAAQSGGDPTTQLLADLIKQDTSNPPGDQGRIAEVLAQRFRPLGFEVDVVPTPDPARVHFIARLRGDGSKKPVLLAAHADAVGVEREKWTLDPFGGVVKDGYVFGRGAIDFKGGIAVYARAVMMLAENKVPLARDVIFLAEADEEGGPYGTSWLAQSHWPKIDCEFALNEGGWIMKGDDGKVKYVSISTADKRSINILVTARGTSTHSSMPRPDNAIFTLGKALAKLADYDMKVELTASQQQFFLALAKTSGPPLSEHIRTLATSSDPAAIARADKEVSKDYLLHAAMRNTIAPVLLNAGFRTNVIPGSAQATINVRAIPGTDPNAVVRELQQVMNDPNVEVKLQNPSSGPSPVLQSSEDTDLYRAYVNQARAAFPGAEVTSYLFPAGTDAAAWRSRGIPVYGTYPYPITREDLSRMHGNDERVSIESLQQGTQMIYRTLVDVAGKPTSTTR